MLVIVLIALLAIAWVLVLRRVGTGPDPVASVDEQRRALEAMAAAADSARRRRAPGGRTDPGPGGAAPSRVGSRRLPVIGLALVAALTLGMGVVLLPRVTGTSDRDTGRPTERPEASRSPAGTPSSDGTDAHPSTTTSTTSTTVPSLAAVAVPDDADSYRITVARAGFVVTVAAEGPCWLQVRSAADGDVIYEGVLDASATQSFPADASLWMRVGAPGAVQFSIDGRTVAPAPGGTSPVDLVFDTQTGGAQ